MTRFLTFLAAVFCAATLHAQTYPDRGAAGLNDFASMVDEETAARINTKLAALADEHDTEVTIATLSSVRFYAQDMNIEDYATGLFNTWAIGDVDTNKGILILVFRDDGLMRVETGTGYDEDTQKQIDRVVDEDIIPHFREDDFATGLESGVDGLLMRVVAPPAANTETPAATPAPESESEGSGNALYYVLGVVGAGIAGLIGLNRRNAAKFAAQPCSACGKTGLQKSREVLKEATLESEGVGESRITCPSCGHVETTPYKISKLRPDVPKGGGQSSGGGSTGKF